MWGQYNHTQQCVFVQLNFHISWFEKYNIVTYKEYLFVERMVLIHQILHFYFKTPLNFYIKF
jgi:hypothetical protein